MVCSENADSISERLLRIINGEYVGVSSQNKESKMRIMCRECGDAVRVELSRIMASIRPDLRELFLTAALRIPVWYMSVSGDIHGPEDAKAIEDALQKKFLTQEYRSVAYSQRKLSNILLTGVDVTPTTSIIFSGRLSKAVIYGYWPKIIMMFDSTKLEPTMRMLGKDVSCEQMEEIKKTYPYMKRDRNGDFWFSRNESEQTRFEPEEHAYAHWIPGDAREALQGVLILDNGLTEDVDDEAFNARLGALFNEKDESWEI